MSNVINHIETMITSIWLRTANVNVLNIRHLENINIYSFSRKTYCVCDKLLPQGGKQGTSMYLVRLR